MIVTLTLNPSLDRTLELPQLLRGEVLRTAAPVVEPGGKGVNVVRALSAHGVPALAVLPVAGPEGEELARLLAESEVPVRLVPVSGRSRTNTAVIEADGTVTKLNEPGPELAAADLEAVVDVLLGAVRAGDWVVLSGSLPPAVDGLDLAAVIRRATAHGALVAVDSSDAALEAAVAAAPRIVKPNREELSTLVGAPLGTLREVIAAADRVRESGVERVLVSLGADGAVLVGPGEPIVGACSVATVRSTVGAGDCLLAGYLAAITRGADESAALLEGLSWGAAAAATPATGIPTPEATASADVRLVWRPDLDRSLAAATPPNPPHTTPIRHRTKEY